MTHFIPLTKFSLNEDTQSVSELWKSIADLSQARVVDNAKSPVYPLPTRVMQVASLRALVSKLEETHVQMDLLQHTIESKNT